MFFFAVMRSWVGSSNDVMWEAAILRDFCIVWDFKHLLWAIKSLEFW